MRNPWDSRMRRLERQWKGDGDPQAAAAWVVAVARSGEGRYGYDYLLAMEIAMGAGVFPVTIPPAAVELVVSRVRTRTLPTVVLRGNHRAGAVRELDDSLVILRSHPNPHVEGVRWAEALSRPTATHGAGHIGFVNPLHSVASLALTELGVPRIPKGAVEVQQVYGGLVEYQPGALATEGVKDGWALFNAGRPEFDTVDIEVLDGDPEGDDLIFLWQRHFSTNEEPGDNAALWSIGVGAYHGHLHDLHAMLHQKRWNHEEYEWILAMIPEGVPYGIWQKAEVDLVRHLLGGPPL